MADYLLTEETRRHRLEEFNRMLPLVKSTLDDWKQLLKEKKIIRTYQEHEKKLESAIEKANEIITNEFFSSDEAQIKMLKKRIKELEEDLKKTKEFISDFEKSKDELENKILYYENFFFHIVFSTINRNERIEPILDKEDIDTKYIREYFYLMFVLELKNGQYTQRFDRELILTQEATSYIKDFIKDQGGEGYYISRKCSILELDGSSMKIVELLEIFK